MSIAETTFQMKNGCVLKCEVPFRYYPASFWQPAECDVGEPTYFIENEEVKFENLPKGLQNIATKMADCEEGQYNFRVFEPQPDY